MKSVLRVQLTASAIPAPNYSPRILLPVTELFSPQFPFHIFHLFSKMSKIPGL